MEAKQKAENGINLVLSNGRSMRRDNHISERGEEKNNKSGVAKFECKLPTLLITL